MNRCGDQSVMAMWPAAVLLKGSLTRGLLSRINIIGVGFYKKLKNVSCEYDRLNG